MVCGGLTRARCGYGADSFGPRIPVFSAVFPLIGGVFVQLLNDFASDLNSASSTAAP